MEIGIRWGLSVLIYVLSSLLIWLYDTLNNCFIIAYVTTHPLLGLGARRGLGAHVLS